MFEKKKNTQFILNFFSKSFLLNFVFTLIYFLTTAGLLFSVVEDENPLLSEGNPFANSFLTEGRDDFSDFPEDFVDPADALAMLHSMPVEEQEAVFEQVREMLAASGFNDVNMDNVRQDIMALSEELEDPSKRKALNEKIYSDLKDMEKDFPEIKPNSSSVKTEKTNQFEIEQEGFSRGGDQFDIVDQLTDVLEQKKSQKNTAFVKSGVDTDSKKSSWVDLFRTSESPLSADNKSLFRRDLGLFLVSLKHVSFELNKLVLFADFSTKNEILGLKKEIISFGVNLAYFSRSFHLKYLFDKAQKTNREIIVNGILGVEELNAFLSKNKVDALLDSEYLNMSVDSIFSKAEVIDSKRAKFKLPAGFLKQVQKQLKVVTQANEKGFGGQTSEGLKKEVEKKKKMLKTTLAVASRYKKPIGGSSFPFGRSGSKLYGGSGTKPSKTGFSNYGKSGYRNDYGRDYGFDRQPYFDSDKPGNTDSAGEISLVKKDVPNESLDSLMESELLKEINFLHDRLDNFSEETVRALSKLFMNESFLDLKDRIENIFKDQNKSKKDDMEQDIGLSLEKVSADDGQDFKEIRKKFQKASKVLFYLSKLPREMIIQSTENIVKKDFNDGEGYASGGLTTTIPFFSEVAKNSKIKNCFDELQKTLSAKLYKKYVKLVKDDSYKIKEIHRKILGLLSMRVFQVDKSDEESWSKKIIFGWESFEKTKISFVVEKVKSISRLLNNFSGSENIFFDSVLKTRMLEVGIDVINALFSFPIMHSLDSSKEFCEETKEMVKLFVRSYQKLINDFVDQFSPEGKIRDSFFLHKILSLFEEVSSEFNLDEFAEESTPNIENLIALRGVVLFNLLLADSEKQVSRWKIKPNDSWQTLFSDLNFLLNFKQNKKTITSFDQLWQNTGPTFKAMIPLYLKSFCRGKAFDARSFVLYEKIIQAIGNETAQRGMFHVIAEKIHSLAIGAYPIFVGGENEERLFEFSFEFLNLLLDHKEEIGEFFFEHKQDAQKVLWGVQYLLGYKKLMGFDEKVFDLARMLAEDFIIFECAKMGYAHSDSESIDGGGNDDRSLDSEKQRTDGIVGFKKNWLTAFRGKTFDIDEKRFYFVDCEEINKLEKMVLWKYFFQQKLVTTLDGSNFSYFPEAGNLSVPATVEIDTDSIDGGSGSGQEGEGGGGESVLSEQGGGLLSKFTSGVRGLSGWFKKLVEGPEAGGEQQVEDELASEPSLTEENLPTDSTDLKKMILEKKITPLRCLLMLHQPRFDFIRFDKDSIFSAWVIANEFEEFKHNFIELSKIRLDLRFVVDDFNSSSISELPITKTIERWLSQIRDISPQLEDGDASRKQVLIEKVIQNLSKISEFITSAAPEEHPLPVPKGGSVDGDDEEIDVSDDEDFGMPRSSNPVE